jgi:AcrR family transcriptional regulator
VAETLKDKVIRAAVEYIADSGPDGLSFRQIAADAGVSHQAPYHHFGDRDAIFTEIAFIGFRTLSADLAAPVGRDEDADAAIRLLERYVNFALSNTGYFRVMFRSDLCKIGESPELQKTADSAFDTLVDTVQTIVGPKATVDQIRVVATTMWSVAHGLATLLIDGPLENKIGTLNDRKKLIRAVGSQVLNGLTA